MLVKCGQMKVVILAAGKGTRMGKLSEDTPKPMLEVLGKPILCRILEALPDVVDEAIITVNHLKEQIMNSIGERYSKLKITYVENKKLLGTADALWDCKALLQNEEKFLVLMGDNLYLKDDLTECLKNPWAILVQRKDSIKGLAKVAVDQDMNIEDIIERYTADEEGYMNTGVYSLTPEIFNYEMVEWGNGEYGLPQTILKAKVDRRIKAMPARFVMLITNPEDLNKAEEYFRALSTPGRSLYP